MRARGNCLKCLKNGVEQNRGGDTKIFKKGCKLGQGVGDLKMAAVAPLRTVDDLILPVLFILTYVT